MSKNADNAGLDPARTVELELGGGALDRAIRATTLLIVMTVIAVVTWTLVARIDELARARGEVKPTVDVQVVESRDGGRIAELLVREGDRVEKGDVIARFGRVASDAELKVALAKQATLLMEIKRYTVFTEGGGLDLEKYRADFPWIVSRQLDAFASERKLLEAETSIAQQKLAEKRAELAALETEIPAIAAQKKATEDALAIYKTLADKHLASKIDMAKAIQEDAAIARQLAEAKGRRTVLENEVRELEGAVDEIKARMFAEALQKRAEASAEVRLVIEQIAALQERVEETVVRSPVAGVVQSVPKTRTGAVIEPGGKVAEIVPGDEGLHLVVRLTPRDVGFVRPGQPAKVKIDAFDYSRYGALEGTVERISPTTFVDERGVAYYEVAVALDKAYFGADPSQFALVPGMTGEADIKTGDKTVFQYMWKPVYTNLDLAFSER